MRNNQLNRRMFLQATSAAGAALTGASLIGGPPQRTKPFEAIVMEHSLESKYDPLVQEIVESLKGKVSVGLGSGRRKTKFQRTVSSKAARLSVARRTRLTRKLSGPSGGVPPRLLTVSRSRGRAIEPLVAELRKPKGPQDFVTTAPPGISASSEITSLHRPQSAASQSGATDFASNSTPHTVAAAKEELGSKVGSLQYIHDKHGRLLTRQRWQDGATYYMGRYFNGGKATALKGQWYSQYHAKGDAEGVLGVPYRQRNHISTYESFGQIHVNSNDPAIDTFYGRLVKLGSTYQSQLNGGFNIILQKVFIDDETGDDPFSGFSDLRIYGYATQPNATVVAGEPSSLYGYIDQTFFPNDIIAKVDFNKSAALLPSGFGYGIQVVEKDDNSLVESLVGEIEGEVRKRLAEAAVLAGTSLAALIALPQTAALLTVLFSGLMTAVADKLFDYIDELFIDDHSDLITKTVQMWSAWSPYTDPYWAATIEHKGIKIHSGGPDGKVDLTIVLDRIWNNV